MEKKQKRIVVLGVLLAALIVTAVIVVALLNKEYRITFDSMGGTAKEEMRVNRGNKNQALPEPIKPGWTFKGWTFTEDSTEYQHTAQSVTGDATMYAQWQANSYIFNLHSDGERVGSIPLSITQIRDGIFNFTSDWILVDQSTRTFQGWSFTDINGLKTNLNYNGGSWTIGTEGSTALPVSVENPFKPSLYDNNLHAEWNYKPASLVFLNEKGSSTSQSVLPVKKFGELMIFSQFSSSSSSFVGWKIDPTKLPPSINVTLTGVSETGGNLSAAQLTKLSTMLGTTFSPGQSVMMDPLFANLAVKKTSGGFNPLETLEIYLYPVRREPDAARFYNENMSPLQNAKTGAEPGIWLKDGGSKVVFNRPEDKDIVSYYYYNTSGARTSVQFGSTLSTDNTGPFSLSHATIFYAQRSEVPVTVNFDYTGNVKGEAPRLIRDLNIPDEEKAAIQGINAEDVKSLNSNAGSVITLPSASMYAAFNKNFVGWQETAGDVAGRIFPAGTQYTVRGDLAVNGAYTLSAYWMDSSVKFVFDYDGGTPFDAATISGMSGETIQLPAKAVGPFKQGYRFDHWIINNDPSLQVDAGAKIDLNNGTRVLKAVWEAMPVTVELRYRVRTGSTDNEVVLTNDKIAPDGVLNYGNTITLPAIEDTNYTGRYRHMGWTFQNGMTYYTGTQVVLNSDIVDADFFVRASSANAEKGAMIYFYNEFTSEGDDPAVSVGNLEFDVGAEVNVSDFRDAYASMIPESMKNTHTFQGFFIVPESQETASMHINTREKYFDEETGAYGKPKDKLDATLGGELILFSQSDTSYTLNPTSYSPVTNFYMYLVPKPVEIVFNYQGIGIADSKVSGYFGDARETADLNSEVNRARRTTINNALSGGDEFAGWEVEYITQNGEKIGNTAVLPYNKSGASLVGIEELKLVTARVDKNGQPVRTIRVTPIKRNIHDFIVYVVDDGTITGGEGSIFRVHYRNVLGEPNDFENTVSLSESNTAVKSSIGAEGGFLAQVKRTGFTLTPDKNFTTNADGTGISYVMPSTISLGNANIGSPAFQFDSQDGSIMLYAQYTKVNYKIYIVNEDPSNVMPQKEFAVSLSGSSITVGQKFTLLPSTITQATAFASWVRTYVEPYPGKTRQGFYVNNTGNLAFTLMPESDRLQKGVENGSFTAGTEYTLDPNQFELNRAEVSGITGTIKFYIVWQRSNVRIIYKDGANVAFYQNAKYGSSVELLSVDPAAWNRPGYEFRGWKTHEGPDAGGDAIVLTPGLVELGSESSFEGRTLDVMHNSDKTPSGFNESTFSYDVELEAAWTPRSAGVVTLDVTGNAGSAVNSAFMREQQYTYSGGVFKTGATDFNYGDSVPVAVGGQFQNTPVDEDGEEMVFGGWYYSYNGIEERVDVDGVITLNKPSFLESDGRIKALTFYVKWIKADLSVFDFDASLGIVLDAAHQVPVDGEGNYVFKQISVDLDGEAYNTLSEAIAGEKAVNTLYINNNIHTAFGGLAETERLASGYKLVGFAIQRMDAQGEISWHITTELYNTVDYSTYLEVGENSVEHKMTVIPVYEVIMITVRFNLGMTPSAVDRPRNANEVKTVSNTSADSSRIERHTVAEGTYEDYIKVPYNTLISLPYITSKHESDRYQDLKFYVARWMCAGVAVDILSGGQTKVIAEDPYSASPEVVFTAVWASAASMANITLKLAIPADDGSYSAPYTIIGTAQFYKKPDRISEVSLPSATYQLPALSDELIKNFIKSPDIASQLTGKVFRAWFEENAAGNGPDMSRELADGKLVRPCNEETVTEITVYLTYENASGRIIFQPNNMNPYVEMGVPDMTVFTVDEGTGLYAVDTVYGANVPLILNTEDLTIIAPPEPGYNGWDLDFIGWTRYHETQVPDAEKTVYNKDIPFRMGYRYVYNPINEKFEYVDDTGYHSTSKITLYAVWEPRVVEIEFRIDEFTKNDPNKWTIYNNGKGEFVNKELGPDKDGKYYLNRPLGTLPVPERVGYTFKGWEDSSGTLCDGEYVLKAARTVLKADFTPNTYKFAFETGTGDTFAPDTVPSELPLIVNSQQGQFLLPKHNGQFSKPGIEFSGWSHDGNFIIETIFADVTVMLDTKNEKINGTAYRINVGAETVVKQPDGTYLITFTANWSSEASIKLKYNTGGGTRTSEAVDDNMAYLFTGALRFPDKAGVTLGTESPDFMTYGTMFADDYGYTAPAGHNFAGWKVTTYDGKFPGDASFPASLKNGNEGKVFFPGDFLPGGLNKNVEVEAVWVPWTLLINLSNPDMKVISLGVGEGYLTENYFETHKLEFGANVETVIIGRGFTRINQGAVTAHNATRILLPASGNLVIEPQAILAAGIEQIYISDNLRGGVLGRSNSDSGGITANVPNIIGGAIINPAKTLKIGGADVTNANNYQLVYSSMKKYLVKQGSVSFDFDLNKTIVLSEGTVKYYYVESASSNYWGVLMSADRKDLIAYPGAHSDGVTGITIHNNVENIKSFAFSYMSATTSLSIRGVSLANIEAYALFSSNIQNLNLPDVLNSGFLDAAAVSGYLPRLTNIQANSLAHFVNGVLYYGAAGDTSVMYVTSLVGATGNVTLVNKHLTVSAAVTSIAPYALSSVYVSGSTGTAIVSSVEILGGGTRTVQPSGMSSSPGGETAGRIDLLHFGTQTLAAQVVNSIKFGTSVRMIDARIFEGWQLPGGLRLSEGMHEKIDAVDVKNTPAAGYNCFAVLVDTIDSAVLAQFKTTWGAWAVSDVDLLNDNSRVQTLTKRVMFDMNTGGTDAPESVVGISEKSPVYGGLLEFPNVTTAGFVLLGWEVVSAGDSNGKLMQPGWARTVAMITGSNTGYLTGTIYAEKDITLVAQWGRVNLEYIDAAGKNIDWTLLKALVVTNDITALDEDDPSSWKTRAATGYDYAGKKVDSNGLPEFDENGGLIDVTSTLVFVLPGWNSGVGTSGDTLNKAFVGWLRNSTRTSIDWDSTSNNLANRILPDGTILHKLGVGETVKFYALYDRASDNIVYTALLPTIAGFSREFSASAKKDEDNRPVGGAVRIPAAAYDTSSGFMRAVTKVADAGFFQMFNSGEVYIGSNVRIIGKFAFQNERYMKSLTFGTNAVSNAPDIIIEDNAFEWALFETLVLPARVVSIGANAFSGNTKMTSVTMGTGTSRLTTIGASAFSGNTNLATLFQIPAGVVYNSAMGTGIGNRAFALTAVTAYSSAVSSGAAVSGNYFVIGNGSLCFKEANGAIKLLNYPAGRAREQIASAFFTDNNITSVGDYAFSNSKISSLSILRAAGSDSQTLYPCVTLGSNVFSWCRGLSYVEIEATMPTSIKSAGVDLKAVFAEIIYSAPLFYVGTRDKDSVIETWQNTFKDSIPLPSETTPQRFFKWNETRPTIY